MSNFLPHLATLQLLRFQAVASFLRVVRRCRRPRRLVLSILAVVLAIVWLGQAALGILYREPADPETLRVWIPLSLLAYTLWHVLKTACRTPIEPFEWTPAEQEILSGAPLRRRELVMYRLTGIGAASVVKAACFSLIMLPDLHVWLAGFIGMLLALVFVDLLRMAIEVFAYGLSRKEFMRFRAAVLVIAGTAMASALVTSLCAPMPSSPSGRPVALDVVLRFLASLADLRTTWAGMVLEMPFQAFSNVILASNVSHALPGILPPAMMVFVAAKAVIGLDRQFRMRRTAAERNQFQVLPRRPASGRQLAGRRSKPLSIPKRLRGAGGLIWRQALGVFHYRTPVLISLAVPAILCCATLLRPQAELSMLMQVVGGLVFYTFVLLPSALKFDFRRDLDRLVAIKALPISPTAVTLGQLAAPVIVAALFQITVLSVAMIARPFHPAWFVAAVVVLIPVNVFIFALENLIFMLYPYRLNQEGVGVFLRSILTFTGKGILFAIALALTLAWALVSKHIGAQLAPENAQAASCVVFAAGMWMLCSACAAAATILLVRVYRGFDPSQDATALS